MTDGPFTDEMIRQALATVQTQHGIIRYAEAMAQVLAEAGRASQKATGDSAIYAIEKWSRIIHNRALEILQDEAGSDPNSTRNKMIRKFKALQDRNDSN